jgi:hypothetical protein
MNALCSAAALIATIIAGLSMMFVMTGSENVHFDWAPMEGDLSLYELAQIRNPMVEEPMTVAEAEEEEGEPMITTAGVSAEMADSVAAVLTGSDDGGGGGAADEEGAGCGVADGGGEERGGEGPGLVGGGVDCQESEER